MFSPSSHGRKYFSAKTSNRLFVLFIVFLNILLSYSISQRGLSTCTSQPTTQYNTEVPGQDLTTTKTEQHGTLSRLWNTAVGQVVGAKAEGVDVFSYMKLERVKFYMYDVNLFSGYVNCLENINKNSSPKFNTEHFLFMALSRHPWRVHSIEEAEIAVVPVLFNRIARGLCRGGGHERNMTDTIKPNLTKIKHLVVANDFKTKYIVRRLRSNKNLIIAEKLHDESKKCSFGIGFSTNYADWMFYDKGEFIYEMNKPHRDRKYFVSFSGQADKRGAYADRRALFTKNTDVEIPNSFIVTDSRQESALRTCDGDEDTNRCVHAEFPRSYAQQVTMDSNFSLVLRGDDPGGDRFQNTMIANTIMVAVIEDFENDVGWLPFGKFIPWKDIVVTLERSEFRENPPLAVNSLLQLPAAEIEKKRNLMRYYSPGIDVTRNGGTDYAALVISSAMQTLC